MKRHSVLAAILTLVMGASLVLPAMSAAAPAVPVVDEGTPTAKPAPVLVVSSYKTNSQRLLVGSAFTLTLNIRNETSRLAENVVVSLASSAAGAGGEGAAAAGVSGLTVLGTGNAKYVGNIKGKRVQPVAFKVVAGPATPPGPMTVPVTVSFEYGGERHELPYTIGLVFERDAGIQVTTAEFPRKAKVGDQFDVSFELANTGSFTLTGMSMSIEATGATVSEGTIFVGGFEAAATEGLDAQITPRRSGPLALRLVATYRDDFGREKTFEQTFKVQVEGEPKPIDNPGTKPPADKDKGNWFTRFFRALFGVEG